MKILYKTDTRNKQRFLKIYTKGAELIQESGVVGTDSPIEHRKTCKGKNIGKVNETSPEEQAKLEMASKIAEKLTEGYFDNLSDAKTEEVILPMLAKSYNDEKDKIDWNNCYVQPKFDGMRCLAFCNNGKVKLISRQGKEITTVPHIIKDLQTMKHTVILDGELYSHGNNFQENMRLVKKYRKGETEKISYHVYDLVSDLPFHTRKVRGYIKGLFSCEEVSTYLCNNEQTLKQWHSNNIADGYEGSIVRWGTAGYKANGRSSNLLKYKDFQDIACKIIDITPSDARPSWGVPTLEYSVQKMSGVSKCTFQAGMKYSHAEREEFLTNKKKYIGKTAEIRFFEFSEDGVPRFPVMVGIRLDK